MASLKELRVRIRSVQNTKKITYAMKLVSAAKLRKSQEAVTRSRQYTDALQRLVAELALESEGGEFSHPLMQKRSEIKKIRLVIVGGSRGLCGGYNSNVNRRVDAFLKEKALEHPGVEFESYIVGKKPAEYYRRQRRAYAQSYEKLPEDANRWPIQELCRSLEEDFVAGKFDEAYVIYTKFKSALSMKVMSEQLLPMQVEVSGATGGDAHGAEHGASARGLTIFEPSVEEVFSAVVPRIMRARVRQSFLDASASEHGSRMTAMEAATKNAGELIKRLQLSYNKARQNKITSELLDIIGGSGAVE